MLELVFVNTIFQLTENSTFFFGIFAIPTKHTKLSIITYKARRSKLVCDWLNDIHTYTPRIRHTSHLCHINNNNNKNNQTTTTTTPVILHSIFYVTSWTELFELQSAYRLLLGYGLHEYYDTHRIWLVCLHKRIDNVYKIGANEALGQL